MNALLALALLAPSAEDLKEPYRVKLVVSVAKNRLLTDVFREQVQRELRDGLQAALGALAKVSVTDKHPLLDEIRAKGLDRALGGYAERSSEQTHFVLIGYDGTQYDIQTRMHDGLTGLSAPTARSASTRDRAFVARLAALLLEKDLSLIGTVLGEPDAGGKVQLELRGGGLEQDGKPVDLSRWVKPDELFSVVNDAGGGAARPQPFLFLQVIAPPVNGVCECRILRRYRATALTGKKATLLATRPGPLRLRVLQEGPRGPEPLKTPVTLQVRRNGFDDKDYLPVSFLRRTKDVDTSKHGDAGRFDKVAFVSVLHNDRVLARIPVPMVDENFVVVTVPPVNEEEGGALDRVRQLLDHVTDACRVQGALVKEINELVKVPRDRTKAIEKVRATLDRMRKDHDRLSRERDEVRGLAETLPSKPSLKPVDDRLKELRSGEKELLEYVANLEKIEKEENDPRRKEWLVNRAKADSLVKSADVEEALAIYRTAPDEFKTEEYKKFLGELEEKWKPKDAAHEKGRRFIYKTWGGLTTASMPKYLKEAEEAVEASVKADDKYTLAKFQALTAAHLTRIEGEVGRLKPDVKAGDEEILKAIKDLLTPLEALREKAQAGLTK